MNPGWDLSSVRNVHALTMDSHRLMHSWLHSTFSWQSRLIKGNTSSELESDPCGTTLLRYIPRCAGCGTQWNPDQPNSMVHCCSTLDSHFQAPPSRRGFRISMALRKQNQNMTFHYWVHLGNLWLLNQRNWLHVSSHKFHLSMRATRAVLESKMARAWTILNVYLRHHFGPCEA